MRPSLSVEARVARLLHMVAGVEESIIRLEEEGASENLIRRLRDLQDEMCAALQQLTGQLSEPR